ncbi:fumarate reductase subunit C [Klebsiella pneumoniae]|nr:fumarate reductase subunit C [Klebsiella pneumoniae]
MTTKRKPYVRPMTSTWWKKLPFYRFYMVREGTAVPTVWFSIVLIYGLFALKHGAESWAGYIGFLQKPGGGNPQPDYSGGGAAAHQNLV